MMLAHRTGLVFAATLILFLALAAPVAADKETLLLPDKLTEQAPDSYKVTFDTSAGPIVIQVTRDWAPLGADRFYNLAKSGFFNDVRFFRVLPGFMAQFGMSGDAQGSAAWTDSDDVRGIASTGAEFSIDLGIGYALVYRFRLGLARQLAAPSGKSNQWDAYLTAGVAF